MMRCSIGNGACWNSAVVAGFEFVFVAAVVVSSGMIGHCPDHNYATMWRVTPTGSSSSWSSWWYPQTCDDYCCCGGDGSESIVPIEHSYSLFISIEATLDSIFYSISICWEDGLVGESIRCLMPLVFCGKVDNARVALIVIQRSRDNFSSVYHTDTKSSVTWPLLVRGVLRVGNWLVWMVHYKR